MNDIYRFPTDAKFDVIRCYEWTTETPKEDGWYWAKHKHADEIEIVRVEDGAVMEIFYDAWTDINSFSHWLGPLPVPELPKGK